MCAPGLFASFSSPRRDRPPDPLRGCNRVRQYRLRRIIRYQKSPASRDGLQQPGRCMASGSSECLADLAHIARRMRANRVEVAQQGDAPVRLGFLQMSRYFPPSACFCRKGFAVCRSGSFQRLEFWADRHKRWRRSSKNKVFDVSGAHGANQAQSTVDIVVVIFQRFLYRFANGFQPGEVDHGVDSVIVQNTRSSTLRYGYRLQRTLDVCRLNAR